MEEDSGLVMPYFQAQESFSLKGNVTVPGDKSLSHRALIMAAMAIGKSTISGLLEGEDVLHTSKALQLLGVDIKRQDNGDWVVHGVGVGGLSAPSQILDMGNAGPGVLLMMGLVASIHLTPNLPVMRACVRVQWHV